MKKIIEKIKSWGKRSVLLFFVSLVLIVTGYFLTLTDGINRFKDVFLRNNSTIKAVESLNVNAPIEYFIGILGQPKIKNGDEYFFVQDDFVVKVLVDPNNLVEMFAVISLNKNFTPWGITKIRFSDIDDNAFVEGFGSISAHLHFFYFELYDHGGSYFPQFSFYGFHDSGIMSVIDLDHVSDFENLRWNDNKQIPIFHKEFREKSSPNMYGVVSGMALMEKIKDDSFWGMDYYQLYPLLNRK